MLRIAVHEAPPQTIGPCFGQEIRLGHPATRNLGLSLLVHGLIITALLTLRIPLTAEEQAEQAKRLTPTEVKIAGHLYYVSDLNANQPPKAQPKLVAPAPARAAVPARPTAAPAPAPAPAPQIAATPPEEEHKEAVHRELARAFIPPEIKRRPAATQTLIQPLSPPDLIPPPTPLPSFRLMTAQQFPKIPKPFVAPGRKAPPSQVPTVAPMAMDLVHAAPVPQALQPKLALPATPAVEPPPPKAVPGPPPAPEGEPVSILSLNDRKIPLSDKLVVPPGNIAQEAGTGSAAGSGAATPAPSAAPTTNSSTSGKGAPTATGTSPTTVAGISNVPPTPTPGTGSSAPAGIATGTNPAGGIVSGSGSSASTGGIVPIGGSGVPGGTGAAASNANGTGTGPGSGSGFGRTTPGQTISRSPTGNFDAVVVQTSPPEQYPESRSLLTGRPIYSVYISVGSDRDWTLFFCVPNEAGSKSAPVKAPYPFQLRRPAVTLPSYEKYVLIHGFIGPDGHFQELKLVRSVYADFDKSLLASLAEWQFRPATKDGTAIQVEFLMSIPAKGL